MFEFVQRRSRLNLLHYTQKKHDNLLILSNSNKNKKNNSIENITVSIKYPIKSNTD